jgi:hypothetical protein
MDFFFLVLPKLITINLGLFSFNIIKFIKNKLYEVIFLNNKSLNNYILDQEPETSNIDIDSSLLTSVNNSIDQDKISAHYTELLEKQRISRFNNALINYDYKTGNYVGY